MSFLRDVIYDCQKRIEFQWARLKFRLFCALKPYRFRKPMKGEISECYTYGRMGYVTFFFCARCGWMMEYGKKRCPVCGQALEWRQ